MISPADHGTQRSARPPGAVRRDRRWRVTPVVLVAAFALAVFTLTRAVLLVSAGTDLVSLALWPSVFVKGLWFDGCVVAVLVAPLLLHGAVRGRPRLRSPRRRLLLVLSLASVIFVLLFVAAAEVTFWSEFQTRFNFIAVDYLIYTGEVIDNICESYPVGWIAAALALLALALAAAGTGLLKECDTPAPSPRRRVACAVLVLCLALFAIGHSDIDDMRGSGNAYADELSGNGLMTFVAALRRNELDYDRFYRTLPQRRADAVLAELGVERAPLATSHSTSLADDPADDPLPFARRPRNVVLLSVESLSAEFLGAYGSSEGLTPNLDRYARRGLRFEQIYATGTRTVRGLEALSLGTPPVPGQAIVRRPGNAHLASVGELLVQQGMTAYFFYGGNGYFDNMNAYFSGNDYHVVDRSEIPDDRVVFENAWGVADEVLLDHAHAVLNAEHRRGAPFFAHIMTTSNHRPYTYPDGRIDIASPGGRRGAVKYTDYAIGAFIEAARSEPWFDETLFVIVADHCAGVAGNTKLPVAKYHIPLIFYAPALLAPGVDPRLASQLDVPPTVIEALGKHGDDQFFGRSLFEARPLAPRAFVSNYQELGYLRDGILTVLLPKQAVESYSVEPVTQDERPTAIHTRLVDEAVAYYQTAARAFKAGALHVPAS